MTNANPMSKCSEAVPSCGHCSRLGLDCVYPQAPTVLPTPPSDVDEQDSPVVQVDNVDSSRRAMVKSTYPPSKSLIDCVLSSSIETREYLAMLESLHFFNNRLLLEVTPAHLPFERNFIDVSQWLSAPRVVQLSLIVVTLAVQRSRSSSTPSFDKDVLHYRSACLSELTALIVDAKIDRQALTFDCIQLVMLADMQLEPMGPWAYHLEGTRRLIELQGGIQNLFYEKPGLQNLLINYMEIDILTSATCSVNALDADTVNTQMNYHALLVDKEEDTITTACFMPIILMQAVVEINKLRLRYPKHNISPGESFDVARHLSRIQIMISTFDPSQWALRILAYGAARPQPASRSPSDQDIAAMTALALCQQAAATLYLHLSCSPGLSLHFLDITHQTLTTNLVDLLSQASPDTEAPLHTQLYKCAVWPFFIAAYAKAGWDLSSGGDDNTQDMDRLRIVARKIQSRPLAIAADVLERVAVERARRADFGRSWMWDDPFESRCSFCVL